SRAACWISSKNTSPEGTPSGSISITRHCRSEGGFNWLVSFVKAVEIHARGVVIAGVSVGEGETLPGQCRAAQASVGFVAVLQLEPQQGDHLFELLSRQHVGL